MDIVEYRTVAFHVDDGLQTPSRDIGAELTRLAKDNWEVVTQSVISEPTLSGNGFHGHTVFYTLKRTKIIWGPE